MPLTPRSLWLLGFVAALAASLAALASPAAAPAREPCYKQLIDDWLADGRIDKTYQRQCYTEAKRHLPADLRDYSSLPDDIDRALQGVVHHSGGSGSGNGGSPRRSVPGIGGGDTGGSGDTSASGPPVHPGKSNGLFGRVIDWLGPSNADSVPLPLIILAAVGLLLLAAGGAGYAARRIQARRLGIPASGPPTGPKP
jgi:hypothetical protein